MNNKFWILFLSLCMVHWCSAQVSNGYWERLPPISGGALYVYPTTQGDTLYARNKNIDFYQDLYRSTDRGASWSRTDVLINGVNQNQSVVIGQKGNLYYLDVQNPTGFAKSYLWRSVDGGQTWLQPTTELLNIVGILETETGALIGWSHYDITVAKSFMYRSVDGGQTWTEVYQGAGYSWSVKSYAAQQLICYRFDAHMTAIYSNDDGLTWSVMSKQLSPTGVLTVGYSGAILYFNGGTQDILRSTDRGMVWDTLPPGAFPHQESFGYPSMTALPSGRIYGVLEAGSGLAYVSDDHGLTWQLWHPQQIPERFIADHELPNGTLLAEQNNSIYRSEDGGDTWLFSSTGIYDPSIYQVEVVHDSMLFVTTPNGIWRTFNGEAWTLLQDSSIHVINTAVGHNRPVVLKLHRWPFDKNRKLYVSSDWGDSFVLRTIPTSLDGNIWLARGDSIIFANGQQGLWRSADDGQTWQQVSLVLYPGSMAFHAYGRYFATGDEGLWFSDDYGRTWSLVANQPQQLPNQYDKLVSTGAGNSVLLMTDGDAGAKAFRSTDNGGSWIEISLPAGTLSGYPLYENSQGHLFVQLYGKLNRSINGGASWHELPDFAGLGFMDGEGYVMAQTSDQRFYLRVDGRDLVRMVNPSTQGAYLHGKVLRDADADCSTDDAQTAHQENWIVKADGPFDFLAATDSAGRFDMFIDTGMYQVRVFPPNAIWWDLCDTVQEVNLQEINGLDTVRFSSVALSECPLVVVNLGIPFLRRCFDAPVYVTACNQGAELAEDAWVDVALDPYLSFVASSSNYNLLPNNTVRFLLGDLQPGDCRFVSFTVHTDCDSTVLGQTHCITAHGFPDTLCTTVPGWSGANLEATVNCQDSLVVFDLINTGPANSQLLDFIIIEDDVVMFDGQHQYQPDEHFQVTWPASGHTIRLESEQEPGHPFSYRVLAFEEGCGGFASLGFINQFSVNGIRPSWHTQCAENVGSYDPNDKQGFPIGTGSDHRIRKGEPIEYMIRFQNTGTDTAFNIVIRDTLSTWLDPTTVVPGVSSHPYKWSLNGSGEMIFTFPQILLPDSTTNLAASQGFVKFLVSQKPDLPDGTTIHNRAAIFFDFNAPVLTNQTWHTIGEIAVTSTSESDTRTRAGVIDVSPNPATDFAVFRLKQGVFRSHRLDIYNALGTPVYSTDMNGEQFVLPARDLPPGAYGWRVKDGKGRFVDGGTLIFL